MKVLFLSLSGIGDALMASPAIHALRKARPDWHLELLTMMGGVKEMYERNQDLDRVLYWNFLKESPTDSLSYVYGLRKQRYDVTVVCFPANRWPYNLIARLIGSPMRLGHHYDHADTGSLNFLNTHTVRERDELHNVEENMRLVEFLGVSEHTPPWLQLRLLSSDLEQAHAWYELNVNPSAGPIFGFHAGSATFKNQVNKRWDWSKYAMLAEKLHEEMGAKVLLFGGPEEYDLNDRIAERGPSYISTVKASSFMQSVAIMSRLSGFVSNDSGLMHVAAALRLPVVSVFGYTSAVHTRPWTPRFSVVRHDLACSPCFYFSPKPASCRWHGDDEFKCIRRIEVDEVFNATKKLMESV